MRKLNKYWKCILLLTLKKSGIEKIKYADIKKSKKFIWKCILKNKKTKIQTFPLKIWETKFVRMLFSILYVVLKKSQRNKDRYIQYFNLQN